MNTLKNHEQEPGTVKESSGGRLVRYRFFPLWQEEKQTRWLEEMARRGWHLEKVMLRRYTFLRGEPAEVLYRLDFIRLWGAKRQEYFNLFRDAGWEHVARMGKRQYFRKPDRPGEAREIYTDPAGHLGKCWRLALVLLALLMIDVSLLIQVSQRPHHALLLFGALPLIVVIYILLILFLGYGLVRVIIQITKLKREIRGRL
jgi:hypothetical protein